MGAADNFFKKAEQALKKKGGNDYAIELLQQGLQIDPDRVEERQKLRNVAIRRCLENGGNTQGGAGLKIKSAFLLGNIKKLGMNKQWEEQIVQLEKFLAEAPQNIDSNMVLARAFEATERWTSALWAYTVVIDIDRGNVDALKGAGRIYEREKNLEKAIQCWERVKESRPEDQEAGKVIRDLSAQSMMARADARKADGKGGFRDLLKDESEADKLQKKASLIRTEDDALTIIQIKKEDIAKKPDDSRLWRELGDLYLKHMRDFDEAGRCYEKAKQVDPHDMFAAERLAKLHEERLNSRVQDVRQRAAVAPQSAQAAQELAAVLAEQSQFMLEDYKRRVEAHPTDYGLKFKYGDLLFSHGRFNEAVGMFQLSRKDPKFANTSNHFIGRCFFEKKLFDLAIKELTSALTGITEKDSPQSKDVRYDLALAFEAKGDLAKALEHYYEILSLDIGYKDVSTKVDQLRQKLEGSSV